MTIEIEIYGEENEPVTKIKRRYQSVLPGWSFIHYNCGRNEIIYDIVIEQITKIGLYVKNSVLSQKPTEIDLDF